VTRLGGGCGAVREVCDRLLAAHSARPGPGP
jgi:3-deoxy-D-manno-octulosonate 8-phosphate phosphatase KdsC-like HAD superfamily phosphatase